MIEKYFQKRIEGEHEIFHIKTPCKFVIEENIVSSLKSEYKSDVEIGGVLWAKPEIIENETIFKINTVSYIRNAIEDSPRTDRRNKSNAYLPDHKELSEAYKQCFNIGHFPIRFHTHPTKGNNFFEEFMSFSRQTETSEQDRISAENWIKIEGQNVLMPRALVVGNDLIQGNIFVGLYHGFIAPYEFEITKKEIRQENLKKVIKSVSKINLNDNQKIALGIGAILLLVVIVKFKKYSLPVIFSLVSASIAFLELTSKEPKYFNRLSSGNAVIDIPEFEK